MEKQTKGILIVLLMVTALLGGVQFSVVQSLKKENKELKEKNEKLERNQKPFDGFKEPGKCAGC